jgi:hypothetical protein
MDEEKETNPLSEFIEWLIVFYIARGLSPDEAQSLAIALGVGIHKQLFTQDSVYNLAFQALQKEESAARKP